MVLVVRNCGNYLDLVSLVLLVDHILNHSFYQYCSPHLREAAQDPHHCGTLEQGFLHDVVSCFVDLTPLQKSQNQSYCQYPALERVCVSKVAANAYLIPISNTTWMILDERCVCTGPKRMK